MIGKNTTSTTTGLMWVNPLEEIRFEQPERSFVF